MVGYFRSIGIALALIAAAAQAQQLYKWVSPDGKINYSDMPPPPSAVAETKRMSSSVVETSGLPFELAEVVKRSPVIFYSATGCLPCDDGRKLLTERGIPFAEKTVSSNADIAVIGSSEAQLPQLRIGSSRLRGFDSPSWNAGLSGAGYPATNKLPAAYRNPPPESAAPPSPKEAHRFSPMGEDREADATRKAAPAPRAPSAPARSADDTTPPGFRF